MKKNKKLLLTGLSAMLIMAMVVTVVSFSMAKFTNNTKTVLKDASSSSNIAAIDKYTNIDNIITYSNTATTDEPFQYVVVEVYSDTPSELKTMCETRDADGFSLFEKYVINGNKSQEVRNVIPGDVVYYGYKASDFADGDNTDALSIISGADFLYVSDKGGKFSKTNDIPEELYQVLNAFAISKYKPVLIDSPTGTASSSSSTGIDTTSLTMSDLITKIYGTSGKYYYTYSWDTSTVSLSQYLSHSNGSMYLKMDGSSMLNGGYWTALTVGEGEEQTSGYMGNYLVISASGGKTLTDKLFTGAVETTADAVGYTGDDAATAKIYKITDTQLASKGYNQNGDVPDYAKITSITLADLESNLDAYDLATYDMVIMESDLEGKTLSDDLYTKLTKAMYAKAHITYASNIGTTTTVTTTTTTEVNYNETNYKELFYNLATAEEVTRYDSVMVTTADEVATIAASNSAASYKPIADLINSSSFRGIGGASSSASMFSVLEIQPCYPIDESVASIVGETVGASDNNEVVGDGNYYTKPSDVVNGKTKEQIAEGTEYYAWELSKAKIADMFNISVDQVNLVQMSTEELAANKEAILGTYDLVYIGGNTSALKDFGEYKSFLGQNNSYKSLNAYYGSDKFLTMDLTMLPVYTMYSHNGDIIQINTSFLGEGGSIGGQSLGKVTVNGSMQESFTQLNGNDITYNKYVQLSEYLEAGMPVIVSDDAANAYDAVRNFGYSQNSIDPDSYMSQLLYDCYTASTTGTNVLWGFDKDATEAIVDTSGDLGSTLTGLVTVFKATSTGAKDAKDLIDVYNASNKRPKLTLTSMPTSYDLYDKNSILTSNTLTYSLKVNGSSNYNVYLYVDTNGNNTFDLTDSSELQYSNDDPITDSEFTFDVTVKKSGSIYWEVLVEDVDSGSTVSYSDLCYIDESSDKKTVNILQLMPASSKGGEGAEGSNTLYFCTICQQSYSNLTYNPYANSATRMSYGALYGGTYGDTSNGVVGGVYLGKHEHNFGIPIYDSTALVPGTTDDYGCDDWDTNWADYLADDYDFDIDIMDRDDFEEMAVQIQKAYALNDSQKEAAIASFEEKLADSTTNYEAEYGTDYAKLETDEEKFFFAQSVAYSELADIYEQLYEYMTDEEYDTANLPSVKIVVSDETENGTTYKKYRVFDADGNEITTTGKSKVELESSVVNSYASKVVVDGTTRTVTVSDSAGNEITGTTYEAASIMNEMIERYITNYENGAAISDLETTGGWLNDKGLASTLSGAGYDTAGFVEQLEYIMQTERYAEYFSIAKSLQSNNYSSNDVSKPYLAYYADLDGNTYTKEQYDALKSGGDLYIYTDQEGNIITSEQRQYADGSGYNNDTYYVDQFGNTYYNLNRYYHPMGYKMVDGEVVAVDYYDNSKEGDLQFTEYYYTKTSYIFMVSDGYADYLDDYTEVKDLELEFKELAKIYNRYAHYDNWISDTYDTVIIGPSEDFAGDDFTDYNDSLTTYTQRQSAGFKGQGLRDLVSYVDNKGQVLLFHNSLTPSTEGTINLTTRLRAKFGQDEYHMTATDTSTYNVEYTTSGSTEKYFLTDITSGNSDYASWVDALNSATTAPQGSITITKYKSAIGYTDITAIGGAGSNPYSIPYKYAEFSWSLNRAWNMAASFSADNGNYGTNRASQNNVGVITKYPFALGSQLNIGGTHPQYYAADIEDDQLTVWYSLAGGTNAKTGSSLEAATPNDGKDNYFIYSYGNIFYCAAGHSKITGAAKDNNDERKLYINIICNSVDDVHDPELVIADYQSYDSNGNGYTNEVVKKEYSGRSYSMTLDDTLTSPQLSFKVDVDSSSKIKNVTIYYDTAITDADARKTTYSGSYTGADSQTKVSFTKTVNDEVFCDIGTDVLSSNVPYDGKDYVYLVIQVEDSNNKKVTKLIKIKKQPYLYDLT